MSDTIFLIIVLLKVEILILKMNHKIAGRETGLILDFLNKTI